jgi:hypothetical protein
MQLHDTVIQREKEVRPYILKYAKIFDIDPNIVRALITQESRFISDAESPTGAFGYGQFTRIGAKQVQNIARMSGMPSSVGLHDFSKADANKPDIGIKAIFATLWWLFNIKYNDVLDKKVQLEAVLTFYNAGGRPAFLVVKHGGHDKALPEIRKLPANYRSQADHYAPQVAGWFIKWHEVLGNETPVEEETLPITIGRDSENLIIDYPTLINTIKLLVSQDEDADFSVSSREGKTEISIIIPGEYA